MLRARRVPKGMSLRRASKLLGVARSTVYYKGKGESSENIRLMEQMEEIYGKDPTIGYRRMKAHLERRTGKRVNHKRVRRLMREMGIKGIAPPPKTTVTGKTGYTNLLRRFSVTRPNQVWCSDITYIRVKGGFAYGASVIDLYSRKVLSFVISNTLDEHLCLDAAKQAIAKYGPPCVIHTDRGKQFVGRKFTTLFEKAGTRISVGEKGFKDNIWMERLWRSYKWECVYLRERLPLKKLKQITKEWVRYYNQVRPHQALGYRTPNELYFGTQNEVAA